MPQTYAPPSEVRIRELDGLRGFAALVVLVHHSLLTMGPLAAAYYAQPVAGTLARLLVYSPLHFIWAGTEAVFLFFVLSGIALSRSAASPLFSWPRYYPSRLARLYLPVVGAVVLGWTLLQLAPRASTGLSAWLLARPRAYPLSSVLHDLLLVLGTSRTISPLWSLQWEVIFSVALPLYLIGSRRIPTWLLIGSCIVLSSLGMAFQVLPLEYLPMFGIGVGLARSWAGITEGASHLCKKPWIAILALIVSVLATTSYWTVARWWSPPFAEAALLPLTLLGIIGLVVLGCSWWPLRALLRSPIARWLGAISFSLYLVHEPIVIAFAEWTHGAKWAIPLSIATALAAAVVFSYLVERPAHALARRIKLRRGPIVGARDQRAGEWVESPLESE